ncbi:hypothetical protein, partial [Methylobacterium adhaesivum]|uniref:hypothetical protein n=1 Tax=Methylobacterium adhaesivum TaxID=333297 RepID=UPI001EDF3434
FQEAGQGTYRALPERPPPADPHHREQKKHGHDSDRTGGVGFEHAEQQFYPEAVLVLVVIGDHGHTSP